MYALRLYSVRRSRYMEVFYSKFEAMLVKLAPVLKRIGYERLEKPVAAIERVVKGLLFDCQMCGQCALSATGMSCSMNCPKNLRNGPCGGVRANGNCEVRPDMPCVWVLAVEGSRRMREGSISIRLVQPPVDRRLQGGSSACCARAYLWSPPSSIRPIRPIPRTCIGARAYSTGMWTASTPPTAAVPTATCRAWPSARCSHGSATRR